MAELYRRLSLRLGQLFPGFDDVELNRLSSCIDVSTHFARIETEARASRLPLQSRKFVDDWIAHTSAALLQTMTFELYLKAPKKAWDLIERFVVGSSFLSLFFSKSL